MSQTSVRRSRRSHSRANPSVRDPLLYEDSPMSKDRQKFLIVCVFDFALASLLWLLSTVTSGDDWPTIFMHEINIFDAHFLQTSLFDIVIVVFLRMVVLLICFAWLRLNHWLPVACTTTITTIYIVIKILFFFKKDHGALPQYLVIISAFINAWIELWLLPFRVLAQERRDDQSVESPPTETTVVRRSFHTTEDEFRSALEFSSDEEDVGRGPRFPPITAFRLTAPMKKECLQLVANAEHRAREILADVGNWKMLSALPEVRYSERLNSYYVRAEYALSPMGLYEASCRDNIQWNVQVKSTTVLFSIDNNTELIKVVSQPAMNGYIASREFIDVRREVFSKEGKHFVCTHLSVGPTVSQKIPLTDGIVRGQNGINVIQICPSATNQDMSVFEWVMNTDVKGRIPKMAIRSTTKSVLLNYVDALQKYITQNPAKYR